MKMSARGLAALLATTAAVAVAAPQASPKAPAAPRAAEAAAAPITAQSLATPRQKASYVVGYELSQMLTPIAPDFDLASFREGVQNLIDGKPPMLTRERAMELNQVLVQRIAARRDPKAPKAPDVSKQEVGRLVSMDLGPSLVGIKDEIDLPIVYRALGDLLAGQAPVLDEATRTAVHNEFTAMVKQKMEAKRAGQSTANREAGQKFLAENKTKKGVFTTGSGLQYMVLRQGSGARPKPSDRVRVNYHGTLLDGTVFDSSYDRGQPAEFMLNQVIPGWTEGVSMMPVGAKYRFWIPSELAYGEKGAGAQIGPNSTLVFDVELLAIAP